MFKIWQELSGLTGHLFMHEFISNDQRLQDKIKSILWKREKEERGEKIKKGQNKSSLDHI